MRHENATHASSHAYQPGLVEANIDPDGQTIGVHVEQDRVSLTINIDARAATRKPLDILHRGQLEKVKIKKNQVSSWPGRLWGRWPMRSRATLWGMPYRLVVNVASIGLGAVQEHLVHVLVPLDVNDLQTATVHINS
jgi:hypothetical protein